MACSSLSIHHIKELAFKQENLFLPNDTTIRLMRVTGTDKNGDASEVTFFLTDDCLIEEVLV
jgi:hypothetical protein